MENEIKLESIFKKIFTFFKNWTSLILSLIALFVSIQTCNDSKRSLKISESSGEPFIQVVDVKLGDPGLTASFITIELTIKNLGQIPATNVSAEMDYYNGLVGPGSTGNSTTRKAVSDIGQGFEEKIRLRSNKRNMQDWKISNYRFYNTAYFYGTVFYTNKLSGKNKKVDWCFELPLNTDKALTQTVLQKSEGGKFNSEYEVEKQ